MQVTQFQLPATESYTRRMCVWVPGGTTGVDGFLTVTCVKKNGLCEGPHTYGVVRDGNAVTVWRIGSDDSGPKVVAKSKQSNSVKQRPYVVTVNGSEYRCSCRSRAKCKHGDGSMELIRRQLI